MRGKGSDPRRPGWVPFLRACGLPRLQINAPRSSADRSLTPAHLSGCQSRMGSWSRSAWRWPYWLLCMCYWLLKRPAPDHVREDGESRPAPFARAGALSRLKVLGGRCRSASPPLGRHVDCHASTAGRRQYVRLENARNSAVRRCCLNADCDPPCHTTARGARSNRACQNACSFYVLMHQQD